MYSKIAILFILSLSLYGCEAVDSAVGEFTDTVGKNVPKTSSKDTNVEINPQTGLIQPTSAANEKQKKQVSQSIGKSLSLDLNNSEVCDRQVRERFLGHQFNDIPKKSLPAIYRIADSEKTLNETTLGRVSFMLDENNKIIKAYCG